jgi:hypothetical protein
MQEQRLTAGWLDTREPAGRGGTDGLGLVCRNGLGLRRMLR